MKKRWLTLMAIVIVSLIASLLPSSITPLPTVHAQIPECGGFTRAQLGEVIDVRGCAEVGYFLCLATDEAFAKAEYAKCGHPQCQLALLEKQLAGALIIMAHDCYPDVISEKCPGIRCLPWVPLKDSDNDGVPDDKDKCPDTPPGTAVDEFGCPKEVLDSDGDGVPDDRDLCPDTPPGTEVDEDGCPVLDSDGDGVPDDRDLCPDTPPGMEVDEEGCPKAKTINLKASKEGYIEQQDEIDNSQNVGTIVISGKVTDKATGVRIEGAKVEIISGADYASTITGADGSYTITAIVPGGEGEGRVDNFDFPLESVAAITLKVSKEGYIEEQDEIDNSQNVGTIIISGKVTDEATGERIEGVKLEIISGADYASTTTNADGTYTITAIVAGGEGEGRVDNVDFSLEFIVKLKEVTVDPNELLADGESSSEITVKVTDVEGNPLEGREITFETYCEDGVGSIEVIQGTTDSDGIARAVYTSFRPDVELTAHYATVFITARDVETGTKGTASLEVNQNVVSAWHNEYIPADSTSLFPSELHIKVSDRWGNDLVNAPITVKLEGESSADGTLVTDPYSNDVNSEITVTTDGDGNAVVYYKWRGAPGAQEILRKVKIIEEQTNDQIEKEIHIGLDLAITKIIPVGFSGETGANAYFKIYIKDMMHPNLDLDKFNEGTFSRLNLRVKIEQYHSEGPEISKTFNRITGWGKDEQGTYVKCFSTPYMPRIVPVNDGYSWYDVWVDLVDRNDRWIVDSFRPNNTIPVTVKTGSPEDWLTIWLTNGVITPHNYIGVVVKCFARYVPRVGKGIKIVDIANKAYNEDLFGLSKELSKELVVDLLKKYGDEYKTQYAEITKKAVGCIEDFWRVAKEYAARRVSQGPGCCYHGAKLASFISPGDSFEELDALMDKAVHGMLAALPDDRGIIVFDQDLSTVSLVDSHGNVVNDPNLVSAESNLVVYLLPLDDAYSLQVKTDSPFRIAIYEPGSEESTRNTYRQEIATSEYLNASMSISSNSDYSLAIDYGGDGSVDEVVDPRETLLDIQGPTITDLQPAEGTTVTTSTPAISADYADNPGGSGVDISTTRIIVDGIDHTTEAAITASSIVYSPDSLASGQHDVTVEVSDTEGNYASAEWTFSVSEEMAPPFPAYLLLFGMAGMAGVGSFALLILLLVTRKPAPAAPPPYWQPPPVRPPTRLVRPPTKPPGRPEEFVGRRPPGPPETLD